MRDNLNTNFGIENATNSLLPSSCIHNISTAMVVFKSTSQKVISCTAPLLLFWHFEINSERR